MLFKGQTYLLAARMFDGQVEQAIARVWRGYG
jgi:hypothetical protein